MAKILAISSQVVSGHVGLSAIQPALHRRGHEVLAVPSVLLSNHPGQQPAQGCRIDPEVISRILSTLAANGRLHGLDALLTGYLPSVEHVDAAVSAVIKTREMGSPSLFLCDPVIGDDPKGVYIDQEAASRLKSHLVPLADIATPNRFELAWLTGLPVFDIDSAITAARRLGPRLVIAKSIAVAGDRLATLAVTPNTVHQVTVARMPSVPSGTGDLLAALFLAGYLETGGMVEGALTAAVTDVADVLAASVGRNELQLPL